MTTKTQSKNRFFRQRNSWHVWNGVSFNDGSSESGLNYSWTDFVTGSENPNWRRIIAQGGNATTELSASRSSIGQATFDMNVTYPAAGSNGQLAWERVTKDILCYPGGLSANAIAANNRAISSLHKQIQGQTTKFDGMVALGELRESVNMLKSPLSALRTGITNYQSSVIRYSKGRSINELNRMITGTYLEAVFGWRPFIKDINNLVKAIGELRKKLPSTRITAYGNDSVSSVASSAGVFGTRGAFLLNEIQNTDDSVRYIVGYRPENLNFDPSLAAIFGFSPERFVPSVWALLPYSWAVDYFSNVGGIINAMSTIYYKPSFIVRTEVVVKGRTLNYSPDSSRVKSLLGTDNVSISGGSATAYSMLRTVSRTIPSGIPMPAFQVGLPTHASSWVNLAAVLAQRTNFGKYVNKAFGPKPFRFAQ